MTTGINNDIIKSMREVLDAGLTDKAMKSVKKHTDAILDDLEGDLQYRLKDALADYLVGIVTEMTKRTIDAILRGNESEMRRYLSCEIGTYWNGRSDAENIFTNRRKMEEWHPIIHGKPHESGCVALRHAIVDAHKDLITSERILDLEDQVRSLVAQVNKANAEKDEMWQRVRGLT